MSTKQNLMIITILCMLLAVLGVFFYKIHSDRQKAALLEKQKIAAEEAAKKAAQEKYDNAFSELSEKISSGELKTEKEFASLLKEVDAFKKRYKDKKLSDTIKKFKKSIADRKSQRISEIMKELAQQVAPLLKQENYTDAAKLYINYKSDFHKETLPERTKIHDSLIAKADALKRQAEELALAEKNRKEKEKTVLLQNIVTAVFEENPKSAYKILKDSPYTEDLKTEADILKNLINADRIVLKSFASDVGRTLDVKLKKGGTRKLKIIEIKNGKIIAEAYSGTIKMQKKISLDMLSIKEKLKRLSKVDEVAAAISHGLYLIKKKQYKAAEASFSKTGPFADILSEKAAELAQEVAKEQAEKLAKQLAEKEKKKRKSVRRIDKNSLWTNSIPGLKKKQYYVSVKGKPGNRGTKKSPWDLRSALDGSHNIRPGSTIWIDEGVYKEGWTTANKKTLFKVALSGTKDAPILVRSAPGKRVTIESMQVDQSNYIWICDLEIASTMPESRRVSNVTGSNPTDMVGSTGGLNVMYGTHIKLVNLIIHNNAGSGVGLWSPCNPLEMVGCIIYDNGWKAGDRDHGHGIYTQNNSKARKTISNCIISTAYGGGQLTIQAYGSSAAPINNYLMEKNIFMRSAIGAHGRVLIGSGQPSTDIHVKDNCFSHAYVQFGYGSTGTKCSAENNIFQQGKIMISRFDVTQKDNKIFNSRGESPSKTSTYILENPYDKGRAHLAVYNWKDKNKVSVSLDPFIAKGEDFYLMDAHDIYGKPVAEGKYKGKIRLKMKSDFASFVILKYPLLNQHQ